MAFVGCGDDVFSVARDLNIDKSNTLSYAAGAKGTQHAFRKMALSTANYTDSVSRGVDANALQSGYFEDVEEKDPAPDPNS